VTGNDVCIFCDGVCRDMNSDMLKHFTSCTEFVFTTFEKTKHIPSFVAMERFNDQPLYT